MPRFACVFAGWVRKLTYVLASLFAARSADRIYARAAFWFSR